MNRIWESRQIVKASEVDAFYQLKVAEILNQLQDAASAHAAELGVGYQAMQTAGLFWVLSWVRLEVVELPTFGAQITVQTWPHSSFNNIMSLRDFSLRWKDGKEFCRARTGWLVVDIGSKRAVPLERLPYRIAYISEQAVMEELPTKLQFRVTNAPIQRVVRYSDLDVNHHVNNARYIEFLMDCYDYTHHQANQLQSLTISFLQETRWGETLNLAVDQSSKEHLIEFTKSPDMVPVLRAKAIWRKRQLDENLFT